MRIDEIISVIVMDIQFHSDQMTIFVPKRKNDKHRNGHSVDAAMSVKISCTVSLAKKLLSLLPEDESSVLPIIRRIACSKTGQKFHELLGISYSTARDVIKNHVPPLVEDFSKSEHTVLSRKQQVMKVVED